MRQAPPPLNPGILFAAAMICFFGGVAITGLAVMDLGPEILMRTSGKVVQAKVTDHRTMHSRRTGTSYQVQYRFQWKGKSHTHSDATGRQNLWSSLPETAWRKAVKTGKVSVTMLPDAPEHSRLTRASLPLGDKLAGLGLGLTLVLMGGGLAIPPVRSLFR
jgi:hypothetical protein